MKIIKNVMLCAGLIWTCHVGAQSFPYGLKCDSKWVTSGSTESNYAYIHIFIQGVLGDAACKKNLCQRVKQGNYNPQNMIIQCSTAECRLSYGGKHGGIEIKHCKNL